MDAANMDFPEASFDAVCISNSLHHMSNLDIVLEEMKRVLRPGGYLILSEMYNDNQAETQMTHVMIHHWCAAVDTAMGITHNETYTRQQILDIFGSLGLNGITLEDTSDLNDNPKNPDTIKYLSDATDEYLKRIEGLPVEATLRQRGLELRRHLEEIGFHNATNLLVSGVKP
jgi:ubiquinone/menaquinone biosynthesis C-methylase UbiE